MKNLKKLEKLILKSYEAEGFVTNQGNWGYEVKLLATWRSKTLLVSFYDGCDVNIVYHCTAKTYKKMANKAIKHYSLKLQNKD